MKIKFLSIAILCIVALNAHAEDVVSFQNFELRAGGSVNTVATLVTDVENYRGFQSDVVLPLGITVTGIADAGRGVESENVDINKRYGKAESIQVEGVTMQKQTVVFAISCNLKPGEGELLHLTLTADESVSAGTYTGYLKNVLLSYSTGTTVPVEESSFTIEVYEGNVRVTLDENSTTAPEACQEPADVCVLRTINANSWSTICLPFAMTEEQTKDAFGSDVQLADFTSYDAEEDDDENIVTIKVNFATVTAIEANHPYIIKVSSPITEFTVDGVDVNPEEDPCVEYDNGLTGKKRKVLGTFIGTYVADYDLYNNAENYPLFLSGGKFYYATENTQHMKGFRAYFDFVDNLTEIEDAAVRMFIDIDGVETGIEEVNVNGNNNDTFFDLSGRKVAAPQMHGVYIINGRKVLK